GTPSAAELTKFQGEFLWRDYRKPGTGGEDLDHTGAPDSAVSYCAPQLFTAGFVALPAPEEPAGGAAGRPGEPQAPAEPAAGREERPDTALMRPQVGRIILDQLRRVDFEPYRLWQPPLDAPWSIEKLVNTHLGR
ncbi:hypothetical protein, partial [Mycobacterium simiae]|uniref:hypothetical protein n=1 Tax=Mycobacterium simiae TaxID=1784 RepID=UPI00165FFE3D